MNGKWRMEAWSGGVADACAGALILAVGMGFGRFAFTGMYPLMVHQGQLTVAGGSLAASSNYLGYLVGALLLTRAAPRHSANLCRAAMVGTIACLGALSLDWGLACILAVRFLAGVFSALAMVMATSWLLQCRGQHEGAPLLFSGVGIGIVASAELIVGAQAAHLRSESIWIVLTLAGALVSAFSWWRLAQPQPSAKDRATGETPRPTDAQWLHQPGLRPSTLILVYGLAGFGYIVTATYLPLFVKNALGGINPLQIWAAFGSGAVPSCFLWHVVHQRMSSRKALVLNLVVQAIGVMLPVCSASAPAFLASAILVGGTFVGTVTIALPAARRIASEVTYNIMAAMTAAYGLGQIAGPLVSNALLAATGSFNGPLLAAGGGLLLAAACCRPRGVPRVLVPGSGTEAA